MSSVPYNAWRSFNPEDTLRFYALRLNEAKQIKSNPDDIIKRGTDWRYLNEVKKDALFRPSPAALDHAFALGCGVPPPAAFGPAVAEPLWSRDS
jgi:hypothetical protein